MILLKSPQPFLTLGPRITDHLPELSTSSHIRFLPFQVKRDLRPPHPYIIGFFKENGYINQESTALICHITVKILEKQHDVVKRSWALEPKRSRFKPCLTGYVALKKISSLSFNFLISTTTFHKLLWELK